MQIPKSMLQAS